MRKQYIIVKSTFVNVFTIKRPKGAIAARSRGVLMVNIINKCILSILVYNLCLNIHLTIYINRYIYMK